MVCDLIGKKMWLSEAPIKTNLRLLHPQVKSNEEGMQLMTELGHYYPDVHLFWFGAFYPILRLTHPKFIAPVLQAPGIFPQDPMTGLFSSFSPSVSIGAQARWAGESEPCLIEATTLLLT